MLAGGRRLVWIPIWADIVEDSIGPGYSEKKLVRLRERRMHESTTNCWELENVQN